MSDASDVLGEAKRVKKGEKLTVSGVSRHVDVNVKIANNQQLAAGYHEQLKKAGEIRQELAVAAFRRLRRGAIEDIETDAGRILSNSAKSL